MSNQNACWFSYFQEFSLISISLQSGISTCQDLQPVYSATATFIYNYLYLLFSRYYKLLHVSTTYVFQLQLLVSITSTFIY